MEPSSVAIERGLRGKNGGQIYTRCGVVKVINSIKGNLDPHNLKCFGESCFGRYLDIPEIKFQGKLIYLCLLHLCDGARSSLRFKINNLEVDFGPEEYFLLTGLKFGPQQKRPCTSAMHTQYFKGLSSLYVGNIKDAFLYECKKGGNGDLPLKLALLWFLYDVLFVRDHSFCKTIDISLMHLIDDLEAFNSYPWGLESYQFFVSNAYATYHKLINHVVDVKRLASVDLYGFGHVLPFWMYYCYPLIGNFCTRLVDNHELKWPRLLRRCTLPKKLFTELKKFFQPGHEVIEYERMIPSPYEESLLQLERQYFPPIDLVPSFSPSSSKPMGRARKLMSDSDSGNVEIPTNKVYTLRSGGRPNSCTASNPHNHNDYVLQSEFGAFKHELMGELVGIRAYLKELVDLTRQNSQITSEDAHPSGQIPLKEVLKDEPGIEKLGKYGIFHEKKNEARLNLREATDCKNVKEEGPEDCSMKEESCLIFKEEDPCHKDTSCGRKRNIHGLKADSIVTRSSRRRCVSVSDGELYPDPSKSGLVAIQSIGIVDSVPNEMPLVVSPVPTVIRKRGRPPKIKVTTGNVKGRKSVFRRQNIGSASSKLRISKRTRQVVKDSSFDPLMTFPRRLYDQFQTWLTDAHNGLNDGNLRLPLEYSPLLESAWFERVKEETKWLSNTDLDVLLNLLMYKVSCEPHLFLDGWTILEATASGYLEIAKPEQECTNFRKYVSGRLPRQRKLRWSEVESVYGIFHADVTHWVAYEIKLLECRIVVYDPMYCPRKWTDVASAFDNMSAFLPWICDVESVFEGRGIRCPSVGRWEVMPYVACPRQPNGHDCGLFSLKIIEFLVAGIPLAKLESVDSSYCYKMRQAYCVSLHQLALKN